MNGYTFLDTQQALLHAPVATPLSYSPALVSSRDRPARSSGLSLRVLPDPVLQSSASLYAYTHGVIRQIDAQERLAFGALAGAGIVAIALSVL